VFDFKGSAGASLQHAGAVGNCRLTIAIVDVAIENSDGTWPVPPVFPAVPAESALLGGHWREASFSAARENGRLGAMGLAKSFLKGDELALLATRQQEVAAGHTEAQVRISPRVHVL
jgi:hypothetical protein